MISQILMNEMKQIHYQKQQKYSMKHNIAIIFNFIHQESMKLINIREYK